MHTLALPAASAEVLMSGDSRSAKKMIITLT